jgi:tetratricopeptide (TPR) repeat protein
MSPPPSLERLRFLEQAVAAGRATPPLLRELGLLRAGRGDWRGAAEALRRYLDAEPEDSHALAALGRALLALQDLPAVRRLAEGVLERDPQAAFAHLLIGHVDKALGSTAEAGAAYTRALELEPTCGEAVYGLVDLDEANVGEALARQAAELAARNDVSVADRVNASFALARILAAEGRHEQAVHYLQRANEAARQDLAGHGIRYRAPEMEQRVDVLVRTFPASACARSIAPLPIELSPIFVVGLPRSGTTLLEQILASHPEVQAGGELPGAREAFRKFLAARRMAGREGPVDARDPGDAELLEAARERYVDALFERDLDGPWVVDKMPANFEIAGFLRLLFPHAPIVHSVRDGRATCFSLYSANFAGHEPYYHDLDDLAHYYRQYRRLMAHWRAVLIPPLIEVRYETLVRDPARQIPALLAAVGLPPHPDCLEFHRHRRAILTASHAQVRRPVYTDAVDRWRHYQRWLGPLCTLEPD